MSRMDNILVFEDTMDMCRDNTVLAQSIKDSIREQMVISESDPVGEPKLRYEDAAKVKVTRRRSFEAARFHQGRTAVHNFASWRNPGGGVVNGSSAQEESLCRISTLYPCLTDYSAMKGFYYPHRASASQFYNDDCIYTPGVVVFKSDSENPKLQPKERWFKVDIITCAAPNLRSGDGGRIWISDINLKDLHIKRLSRILDIAAANGVENIILGAFGCGAFRNDPRIVAEASAKVIRNYLHIFRVIEFAIYSSHGDDTNYREFADAMERISEK